MARDPRTDAYIEQAADFARPILRHLRELVHATLPVDEAIKWGMPHFTVAGKNLAGIAAFKAHCAFVIHGDGRQGDAMGQYGKIATLADLPADSVLADKLRAVAERIATTGKASPRTATRPKPPKAEISVPDDLAAALAAAPAAKASFEGFAPSHRREYLEWIVEAKWPETRARRIAQAIEWLAQGRKRNWKYEGC